MILPNGYSFICLYHWSLILIAISSNITELWMTRLGWLTDKGEHVVCRFISGKLRSNCFISLSLTLNDPFKSWKESWQSLMQRKTLWFHWTLSVWLHSLDAQLYNRMDQNTLSVGQLLLALIARRLTIRGLKVVWLFSAAWSRSSR